MKEFTASIIGILIGASIFAVLCFIFDAPTKEHFIFATLVGAFTGLLAAPEFSPESYKYPTVFQVFSGVGAGLFVGLFFNASNQYILGLCIVGAVIGFFAKYFIDAIHVP
jgi:hypothetical protein